MRKLETLGCCWQVGRDVNAPVHVCVCVLVCACVCVCVCYHSGQSTAVLVYLQCIESVRACSVLRVCVRAVYSECVCVQCIKSVRACSVLRVCVSAVY